MPGLSIPVSDLVTITPEVLAAGQGGLSLNGLRLTNSTRVPINTVLPFADQPSVAAYFGVGSSQATEAGVYFSGFDNSDIKPGTLLYSQYPWAAAVPAYLRGGVITLAAAQAVTSGVLTITIDGVAVTSSALNLSTAGSLSAAAATIQAALNAGAANYDASFTGSIAPATSAFTGVLTSGVLAATSVTGPIVPGATVAGSGVTGTPTVVSQISGTPGGAGSYQLTGTQTLGSVSMTSANAAVGVMTAASALTGTIAVGQNVQGVNVTSAPVITALLSGTGGLGTYIVSVSETAASATINTGLTTVTYDSVSGGFLITGGTPGTTGTITFATGTGAAPLLLTSATGAVLSQGAAVATPTAYMDNLVSLSQNWATFSTDFAAVTADKEAFAAWTSAQNNRYGYAYGELSAAAYNPGDTTLALYAIIAAADSGTMAVYEPSDLHQAIMLQGFIASVDYNRTQGRATMAYRTQSGMPPGVTDQTTYTGATGNGYNVYGAFSNYNTTWNFFQKGTVTGPFKWIDTYANQIWFNSAVQSAIVNMLASFKSLPYSPVGYGSILATLQDPINAAVNNGVIQPGVPLSSEQAAEVNNAAGANVAPIISTRGWYAQVQAASATTRAARQSPPISIWYSDGESIQQITIASIVIQ